MADVFFLWMRLNFLTIQRFEFQKWYICSSLEPSWRVHLAKNSRLPVLSPENWRRMVDFLIKIFGTIPWKFPLPVLSSENRSDRKYPLIRRRVKISTLMAPFGGNQTWWVWCQYQKCLKTDNFRLNRKSWAYMKSDTSIRLTRSNSPKKEPTKLIF